MPADVPDTCTWFVDSPNTLPHQCPHLVGDGALHGHANLVASHSCAHGLQVAFDALLIGPLDQLKQRIGCRWILVEAFHEPHDKLCPALG